MTKLLERAFSEAADLPRDQQDSLGEWILAELDSERRWDEALARSGSRLGELAEAALREHEAGNTRELDPDEL